MALILVIVDASMAAYILCTRPYRSLLGDQMKIDVRTDLVDEQLEQAWQLYDTAFRHLNALTVQRHLMYRSEFDEVMTDTRIEKWLAYSDDGVLLGLATYTNLFSA